MPPEALANPTIAQLQSEYQLVMNEFKEAHKQHQKSLKENSKMRELRSDIEIIDAERGNGEPAAIWAFELFFRRTSFCSVFFFFF